MQQPPLEYVRYSDKAIAIFESDRAYNSEIKKIGGTWNNSLSGRKGWILPFSRLNDVANLIAIMYGNPIHAGQIAQQIASQTPMKVVSAALQPTYNVGQPQMVPLAPTPAAFSAQDALSRLQIAQPPTQTPTFSPIQSLVFPSQNLIMKPPSPSIPRPFTMLQPQPVAINYPNLFTAADGLQYQIIVSTVPLPFTGQRVTVQVADTVLDYRVSAVEKTSPPFDSITITEVLDPANTADQEPARISRAVLINGQWKVFCMQDEHTITFYPNN